MHFGATSGLLFSPFFSKTFICLTFPLGRGLGGDSEDLGGFSGSKGRGE